MDYISYILLMNMELQKSVNSLKLINPYIELVPKAKTLPTIEGSVFYY